ncbi:MAG: phage tail tape measure protein, partial [Planctomycetes bacterium GWF2_50_10]
MANTGAIRAGRAYVELFADSSKLIRGLKAAEKKLAAFGANIQKMGLGMAGIGAAITMPLLKVAQFAGAMGDKLADMSKRTGVSVESLSALQYVGSQTGVELDTLQKSLLIMHKNLYAAADGSKSAKESLAALGLTVSDLKGMAPEEQFATLADHIAAVKDPSQKAAIAMKIFGKSGAQLLPMFADGKRGIGEMIDEAKELGLIMSTEDAEATSNFDDALNKLWATIKMAFFRIGSALIPVLKKFVDTVAVVISKCAEWIKQNKGVVVSIMWFGAVLAGAGLAIAAFGTILAGLAKVTGIIVTVFGAIRTAVMWMLTPFGAIVTLLTAGVAAFLHFSGYGAKALSWLGQRFAELKADAVKSFQGISAALAKGDIGLAARIAWLLVKMEFLKAKQVLLDIWLSIKGKILEVWYGLGYAMVLAWDTAVYGLKVAWIETVAFLKKVWAGFKQWWGDTVD